MKEFNSVGVPSLKSALKEYFKSLIDKGIYEVDVTCINSEIMQVIENIPQLPVVPLDVHERMKRELNTEIENVKEKSIYFAKECQKARAETDRVTAIAAEWKDAAYKYADSIDKIKAEAIKEFAERIDTHFKGSGIHWLYEASLKQRIDNLVKEMVGDAE